MQKKKSIHAITFNGGRWPGVWEQREIQIYTSYKIDFLQVRNVNSWNIGLEDFNF